MSNYSWSDDNLNVFCSRCHWKDKDPDLCHIVEPPMEKPYIPTENQACGFIPESYWSRTTQERKDELNEEVRRRSKLYYKK